MKILIFCDWFEPAYKAGGPVRSIVNLVNFLKPDHELFVFTSDRDLNDQGPFPGIQTDGWKYANGFNLYYYSPGSMTLKKVKQIIRDVSPDRIYLNSMFSNMILPLLAAGRSGKIVLAPRGMLKESALAVKPIRKYFYLHFLKLLNLEQYIRFHSSGPDETRSIYRIFPKASSIIEAPNLPVSVEPILSSATKEVGELKLIFVGRMQSIKNLHFLLDLLLEYPKQIELTTVATSEDPNYARECKDLIDKLRAKHQINLYIDLPHPRIKTLLEQAHLFVLPTLGESFGHAIFEALAVGCPVLISNQTPWINLAEQKAGCELPLEISLFLEKLNEFQAMGNETWQQYRQGARSAAESYIRQANFSEKYKNLFHL